MAWNKVRNTALASLVVLLLGGVGTVVALKHHRTARPLTVRTFEPMAGEWEGTFVMSGNGLPQPVTHNAALSINAVKGGRACQIEMRVLAPDGGAANIYRFTHSLNDRGDRIITLDDPNIARPLGEGHVTVSSHDTKTGEWRAGFRASIPNNGGATDCEWSRTADQLSIVRRDQSITSRGSGETVSELRLRRVGAARL